MLLYVGMPASSVDARGPGSVFADQELRGGCGVSRAFGAACRPKLLIRGQERGQRGGGLTPVRPPQHRIQAFEKTRDRYHATLCYMEQVTHREMRNRSGEILRRVESGESIEISNNGRPAAIIIPVSGNILDGLVTRGEARAARASADTLTAISRTVSAATAREITEDSRSRW